MNLVFCHFPVIITLLVIMFPSAIHSFKTSRVFRGMSSYVKKTKISGTKTDTKPIDPTSTNIAITSRQEDYSTWYTDVISAADMIDQSAVRGCMVIKPWGMSIWDLLRTDIDARIKETGTENAYFPLFIPKSFLAKEAEHVEGFAKECAVVTHHRLRLSSDGKDLYPDPTAKLEEPLIVRPTSETVIWNMYSKWISSYRDLPLKLNQWANVVRWEMRTRPFLRTSEFLWQEGHTAHATSEDAIQLSEQILDMYESICKDMLAMPVVKGRKSPSERFAGAEETYTIEALMQNGWALQSGTSHFLGQNFAKAFDVKFQSVSGSLEYVWATSWGVSTRLIGALIMTHSDDKGLVLPPPVAPIQVVIVPITKVSDSETSAVLQQRIDEIYTKLKKSGIRVKVDDRLHMRPGAKYFEWERKGVPLRIDLGARDVTSNSAVVVSRLQGNKSVISTANLDEFVENLSNQLKDMHTELYNQAVIRLQQRTFRLEKYEDMKTMLNSGKVEETGFYLVPWKCNTQNEEAIKEDCKATIRCYPFEHNKEPIDSSIKCFYSGEPATHYAIFARAY